MSLRVLVVPLLLSDSKVLYLIVAETFAPVAECLLFWAAFDRRDLLGTRSMWRDLVAIVAANLASFGAGEGLRALGWLDWIPGLG